VFFFVIFFAKYFAVTILVYIFAPKIKYKKNMEIGEITAGQIGLVQLSEDNVIRQIGLTEQQRHTLEIFLASLSKEKPLVLMGEEYDLVLKKDVIK
jgi:hypothetical protein